MAADPDGIWPLPEWLKAFESQPEYDWAILGWRRAAAVPGAWFDYALADGLVEEWPKWARLTTDRFAGVAFHLLPWQELIVRLLAGWMAPTEVLDPITHQASVLHGRLFRRLLLWIPRKNGKSEFLAALALMFAAIDALPNFEGYVFARDEEQASTTLGRMKLIAAASPQLQDATIGYAKSLYFKELTGSFVLLTGADAGKHGKMPSVIVGDEMHEWRSLEIANTLRQGTGTRLEPIELYASTAGRKTNKIGLQLWDESQGILTGRIHDPTTLVVIFAAAAEADYEDEAAWALANPSLGLSPTKTYLRREAALCKDNPRAQAAFRCFHLNQWVEEAILWLPLAKWDACTADRHSWKSNDDSLLIGRPCYGAFDVSSTVDITALIWVFPPTEADPIWRVRPYFWVPADTLARRVKVDQVPYDRWTTPDANGVRAMETTPGDYVDQNFLMKGLLNGIERYDVQRIGFDPWNARKLVSDLEAQGVDPELCVEMRQGIQTLGEPSKQFERLIYAGQFDHGGHPVLRWMAGNTVVRFDENLNYAPAKKRSREKIDGIVASVMAVGVATIGAGDEMPDPEIHFL